MYYYYYYYLIILLNIIIIIMMFVLVKAMYFSMVSHTWVCYFISIVEIITALKTTDYYKYIHKCIDNYKSLLFLVCKYLIVVHNY